MRIDVIRKRATTTLCSGVLVGLLSAAGCSERPASGNKLDDPNLKAYMQKTTEQFKTKTQDMKTKNPKGVSPKGGRHP
jgi:hypothetical protein